jgi:microcystin-dependent protein
MNNINSLAHAVNIINYETLPIMQQILFNINLHVGEYKWSAKSNDFFGWMICDGRSVARSDFPDLYDVIGTSFGSNNDFTFNLPDFRSRVMGGLGQGSNLSERNMGDSVGAETHTMTSNQLPSHTHSATSSNAGSHNHGGASGNAGAHTHSINDPGHTHTQTTINDDFNYSGENPPGFAADSAGVRNWSNINSATTGITIQGVSDHAHVISTDGSHSHGINIATAGGGLPFNIMQPTLFAGNVFIFAGFHSLTHNVL